MYYEPWPWYIAGPLIGLTIPALLLFSGKVLGFSSNFSHSCAACSIGGVEYFKYNWKSVGRWNLLFLAESIFGCFRAGYLYQIRKPIQSSASTIADLRQLGVS